MVPCWNLSWNRLRVVSVDRSMASDSFDLRQATPFLDRIFDIEACSCSPHISTVKALVSISVALVVFGIARRRSADFVGMTFRTLDEDSSAWRVTAPPLAHRLLVPVPVGSMVEVYGENNKRGRDQKGLILLF